MILPETDIKTAPCVSFGIIATVRDGASRSQRGCKGVPHARSAAPFEDVTAGPHRRTLLVVPRSGFVNDGGLQFVTLMGAPSGGGIKVLPGGLGAVNEVGPGIEHVRWTSVCPRQLGVGVAHQSSPGIVFNATQKQEPALALWLAPAG
jgi:hypothetical protein